MKLQSSDGAHVELRPTGYQFAGMKAVGIRDWDANWLVVVGNVLLADGRHWSFVDSCLTTWEARQLGEWLHGVLVGDVHPDPFDGEHAQLTYFTEPNVGVSLATRDDTGATIRFHFSLERAALAPARPTDRAVRVLRRARCDTG